MKKLLYLTFSLTLILTAFAVIKPAYADQVLSDGSTITIDNATTDFTITSSGAATTGIVSIKKDCTVTLKDLNIKTNEEIAIRIAKNCKVTLKFEGKNKLVSKHDTGMGIYVPDTASLTIQNGSDSSSSLNTSAYYGFLCYGDLTISSGQVTAKGTHAGFDCRKNLTISGGQVKATGDFFGINCRRDLTISGGKVTATANADKTGIYALNDVTSKPGFSTTSNGKAFITVEPKFTGFPEDESGLSGIIFQGKEGKVYGQQTLTEDYTIAKDQKLVIAAGTSLSLDSGVKLINNGKIVNKGTFDTSKGTFINNGKFINKTKGRRRPNTGIRNLDEEEAAEKVSEEKNLEEEARLAAEEEAAEEARRDRLEKERKIREKNLKERAEKEAKEEANKNKEATKNDDKAASSEDSQKASKKTDSANSDNSQNTASKKYTVQRAFKEFTDIAKDHWAYQAVKFMFEYGLLDGLSDDIFGADTLVTRDFVIAKFYEVFCDEDGDYKAWAINNKIILGYDQADYGYNKNITREQLVSMLYRYAEYKKLDLANKASLAKYVDNGKISGYAQKAFQWAVANGIIKGTSEITIDPNKEASKLELAAILQRFIEKFLEVE